jgi:hypothetical protein
MPTSSQKRTPILRRALLVFLTLSPLLSTPGAFAAERDGTVLFFSAADLTAVLSHPALPDLSPLPPTLEWQDQQKGAEQDSPLERNSHWGNGLGSTGMPLPACAGHCGATKERLGAARERRRAHGRDIHSAPDRRVDSGLPAALHGCAVWQRWPWSVPVPGTTEFINMAISIPQAAPLTPRFT